MSGYPMKHSRPFANGEQQQETALLLSLLLLLRVRVVLDLDIVQARIIPTFA
jgi:hypothetical protein